MRTRPELPAATPRFDGVDLLRGLSIVAVVLLHTRIRFVSTGLLLGTSLPRWLRYLIFFNGGNGVKVFFAISGFLITTTSLRRFGSLAAMRPRIFYRIRFARIAPLLLALLAVLSALHLTHADGFRIKNTTLPRALFAALTFHLNWLEAVHNYLPPNWDVLWSLSIEEMFYLFFPLLCVALLRVRRGLVMFVAVLLAFVVMGPFARTVWNATDVAREKTYLGGFDAIALGCLAALLTAHLGASRDRLAKIKPWLVPIALLGSAILAIIALWPRWRWLNFLGRAALDDTLLPIGACCVMLATVLRGRPGSRWTASFRWFGRHSYEVYLTHEFVVVWGTTLLLRVHRGQPWLWCVGILACTAPLGWAVARWFSEPMNRALRGAAPPARTAD